MYTYCTKEQWDDEYFDLDYIADTNGKFASREEAQREAQKHGAEMILSIEEPQTDYMQMSMYEILNPNRFCWDEDINQIVEELDALVDKYGLDKRDPKWEIWSHVPQYGYRLTYTIKITRKQNDNDNFHDELQAISERAKEKKINLRSYAPHYFTEDADEKASINVYSMFEDRRMKEKGPQTYQPPQRGL